jgi:hypothetical protein
VVRLWPWGMRRHEEAFAQLPILLQLPEPADPRDALSRVAAASAASLPKGNQLGQSYLEQPSKHFRIKEARAGRIERVQALLVWTDPRVLTNVTGGVSTHSGSSSGDTFAVAELPREVPWASIWFRPRGLARDPEKEPTSDDPAFDQAFLWAGDDPRQTLPAAVTEVFLAAPKHLFAWASFTGRDFCAHSIDSPDSSSQAERLIPFVVSVANALDSAG